MLTDEQIREFGKGAFGIDINFDGSLMAFARKVEAAALASAPINAAAQEQHAAESVAATPGAILDTHPAKQPDRETPPAPVAAAPPAGALAALRELLTLRARWEANAGRAFDKPEPTSMEWQAAWAAALAVVEKEGKA